MVGADGFTNTFEVFEFKVGGRWKFVMHSADGKNYPNESEFAFIEPEAKVVIKDRRTAQGLRHIVEPANEQNLDRLTRALGKAAGAG